MNQGKYVICGMVAIGLGMAFFAWWARYSASQRVLARFGPDVTVAVRNGKTVELLRLGTESSLNAGGETIQTSDGTPLAYIVERRDITDAPGMIHARHHLLHERGFQWDEPSSTAASRGSPDQAWTVAIRFVHDSATATWLFDFQQQRAFIVERETDIGIAPIAPSLKTFIDQFPAPAASSR